VIGIVGGQVLTPTGLIETDVWLEGPTVVSLGSDAPFRPSVVLDASGMFVGPGLVDLHTHLRDPGQTWKEDIDSGSRAAAVGGYTAITAMPNTLPPIDSVEVALDVVRRGVACGQVLITVAGSLTVGRLGRNPADHTAMYDAGVRVFTDDGESVTDPEVMRRVMESIAELGDAVVAQHAEDPGLSGHGQVHDGKVAERLGLAGIPSEAESTIVARDLGLAAATGLRYHVQHVSSAETVSLVRQAKASGIRVTAEVTPHHLSFDESWLTTADTNLKMYPPLRSATDRMVLIGALSDRTIDVVATDHAPHTAAEKSVSFKAAPRGVMGLETASAAVWEVLGDPEALYEVMSVRPARIGGLSRHGHRIEVGSPANLMVFDPESDWVVETFASKSTNSPYLGRAMRGRVAATIYEGTITHQLERVS
jgi:dihydroorotase